MPENDKNKKPKLTPEQEAAEREARMKRRAEERKVRERARKIEAARKEEEAKIEAEERKERMARRKAAGIEEQKRKKEAKKKIETDKAIEGLDLVDFAVTSRSYSTQLTTKFKARKFWEDPDPYEIQSYIPGTIISVDVKEKEVVEEGKQLLILEAMKMQNRIDMPFTARVKKINVKPGEKIPKDFVMIELEPVED